MVIATDYRLWCVLFQDTTKKRARRLTRAEAFFNLVQRQRLSMQMPGYDIADGGYQQLAEEWGWDRTTVRKFLQELTDIGAVSTEIKPPNRRFIKLLGVTTGTQPRNDAGESLQGLEPDDGNVK